MSEPQTIYGVADVARLLHVTRAAVTNWRDRYDDTPPPAFISTTQYEYWSIAGMRAWKEWHRNRAESRARGANASRRLVDAEKMVDQLRAELDGEK